jgi:hypothetical protein
MIRPNSAEYQWYSMEYQVSGSILVDSTEQALDLQMVRTLCESLEYFGKIEGSPRHVKIEPLGVDHK